IKQKSKKTNINITAKNKFKKKNDKFKQIDKKGRVVIKNLSFKTTEDDIKKHFGKYGNISEIQLLRRQDGGIVGCGFVQFANQGKAAKAIEATNGKDFMGRKIDVDFARSKLSYIISRSGNEQDSGSLLKPNYEPLPSEFNSEIEIKEENIDSDAGVENKVDEMSHLKLKVKEKKVKRKFDEGKDVKEEGAVKKTTNKEKPIQKRGRLIVRNLPFKVTETNLKEHFSKFGDITEVKLLRKADGKLVGCGFIQFTWKQNAAKAILGTSGKPFLGRMIVVDWALPKNVFENKTKDSEVEIKTEPIDEETTIKLEDESVVEESDYDDLEADHTTNSKNTKLMSNDVSEGRTVFVKNIPFSVTNKDFKTRMEQFGSVFYALICVDPLTEHSKGTGFVKFQTKESAELCLSAGTELMLHDQILDVFPALNKEDAQNRIKNSKEANKNKDSRNLYLVKEGVVLAGSKAALGVSTADMARRLQLEQWKSQILRNLNMCVAKTRLIVHNIPSSWDDAKLHQLFASNTDPNTVIREARIMRDMRNMDAQGVGNSKEYGFVSFSTHEGALHALRKINNNPDVFSRNKRPIVAFSIENKAILNLKQKRLMKSREKNQHGDETRKKPINKQAQKTFDGRRKYPKKFVDFNSKNIGKKSEFVGESAKPGKTKLRSRFNLKTQAALHSETIRKDKHKQKVKQKVLQQRRVMQESLKQPQQKKGRKTNGGKDEEIFNKLTNGDLGV
ncbi:unnamed protein product, partial [Timema podura]|nr:unnamed protein product [Timema podura]